MSCKNELRKKMSSIMDWGFPRLFLIIRVHVLHPLLYKKRDNLISLVILFKAFHSSPQKFLWQIICGTHKKSLMLFTWDHVAHVYYFSWALESKSLTQAKFSEGCGFAFSWKCPVRFSWCQVAVFLFFFSFFFIFFYFKHLPLTLTRSCMIENFRTLTLPLTLCIWQCHYLARSTFSCFLRLPERPYTYLQ